MTSNNCRAAASESTIEINGFADNVVGDGWGAVSTAPKAILTPAGDDDAFAKFTLRGVGMELS